MFWANQLLPSILDKIESKRSSLLILPKFTVSSADKLPNNIWESMKQRKSTMHHKSTKDRVDHSGTFLQRITALKSGTKKKGH